GGRSPPPGHAVRPRGVPGGGARFAARRTRTPPVERRHRAPTRGGGRFTAGRGTPGHLGPRGRRSAHGSSARGLPPPAPVRIPTRRRRSRLLLLLVTLALAGAAAPAARAERE